MKKPTSYNRHAHRTAPKAKDYQCDLCGKDAAGFLGNWERGVYTAYCQEDLDAIRRDQRPR